MILICGGLVFKITNLDLLKQFLPNCFYRENYTLISENEHLLKYQNFDYKIKIESNFINDYTAIYIYSNNPYYKINLHPSSIYKLGGFPELLRSYLCFILEKSYLEIEFFSPIMFEKILPNCSERYLNHSSIRLLFRDPFNHNGLIESEILDNTIKEIEFQDEFYENIQPAWINLKVSINKKHSIEAFFLKVGISLNWDNQIFFDTIFLPTKYEDMIGRFRTGKSIELIKSIYESSSGFKQIYMVTEEDNLSFLIESKETFIYIEEVFWWS